MSRYRMVLVHDDDSRRTIDGGFEDLSEACRAAFRIAHDCGRRLDGPGSPPSWVSIYRGDALELSVQVTAPPAEAPRTL